MTALQTSSLQMLANVSQSVCLPKVINPPVSVYMSLCNTLPAPISRIICVIKNCEKRLRMTGWKYGNSPVCIPREQSDSETEETGSRWIMRLMMMNDGYFYKERNVFLLLWYVALCSLCCLVCCNSHKVLQKRFCLKSSVDYLHLCLLLGSLTSGWK